MQSTHDRKAESDYFGGESLAKRLREARRARGGEYEQSTMTDIYKNVTAKPVILYTN